MSRGREILDKILLVFLIFVAFFVAFIFVREQVIKSSNKKFYSKIVDVMKEEENQAILSKTSKVYVKLKNNIITDYKCLNSDCKTILKDQDFKDKKVDELATFIYNNDKKGPEKVNVMSKSSRVETFVSHLDYSKYTNLTKEEEKKIFDENKINVISKDEYNKNLLEELKKDKDYGKTHTCDIYNDQVKCYVTDEMENILNNFDKQNYLIRRYNELIVIGLKFNRLINKFDFNYNKKGFVINNITLGNNIEYGYTNYYNLSITDESKNIKKLTVYNTLYTEDDLLYLIPFSKIDLLSKTVNLDDIIISD